MARTKFTIRKYTGKDVKEPTVDEQTAHNSSEETGLKNKKAKFALNANNEEGVSHKPKIETFVAGKDHKELKQPEIYHYTSAGKRAYDDHVEG